MSTPLLLTPDEAHNAEINYELLLEQAKIFLYLCGAQTMKEQEQHGMKHPAVSANEVLGMATRVIAEQALHIQVLGDEEEAKAHA